MTEFIISYWVEFAFALVSAALSWGYRRVASEIKEQREKQSAMEKGIKALLRDRIVQTYNHYKEKGYCPIYALENVEELYVEYQALGGNGTMEKLYEDLKELPTVKKASPRKKKEGN